MNSRGHAARRAVRVTAVLCGLAQSPAWAGPPSAALPARLSFISERHGQRDVYLIATDGRFEQRLTHSAADESNGPVTPDGRHILVTAEVSPPAGAGDKGFRFLLLPLSPGTRTQGGGLPLARDPGTALLPTPRASLRQPQFLADGRLVFESEPQDPSAGLRELFVLSQPGAVSGRPALRALTQNREGNFGPSLCARSDYVAFTSSRDRTSEVYRMRADGSDVRRLTYSQGSKWGTRCSADGQRIFFVSDREGADRIYSVLRNGSEPRRLTNRDLESTRIEDSPTPSPEGRKLAYVLRGAGLGARLRILDLRSGRDCELPTPPGSRSSDPDWSTPRDNTPPRLAFTLQPADSAPAATPTGAPTAAPNSTPTAAPNSAPARRQIFLADADCRGITQLTHAPGPNWHPLWLN